MVDDNHTFLDVVTRWASSLPQIQVAGTARSGQEAVEQVVALRPDLVVMDVVMPVMNGFEATRLIKALPNPPKVVLASVHYTAEHRQAAETVGADAFLPKSELITGLPPLINRWFMAPAE